MKILKFLLAFLMVLGSISFSQAQILKKLKKKIEKGVEQTVIDKTNEKMQHGVSNSMDKMLEDVMSGESPIAGTGEMADMQEVPDAYEFSYVYTLEMKDETRNEATAMDMYLEPGAQYWGMQLQEGGEMTMVHDADRKLMVMFMSQDDQKMAMAFKTDISEVVAEEEQAAFQVRQIEGKEIMGYQCDGFEVETEEYLVTVYNTFEAEVSLANVFGVNKDLPDNFDPKWIKKDGKYGLLMEMFMKDKSGEGNDVSMRCLDLSAQATVITKSEYQAVSITSGKQ